MVALALMSDGTKIAYEDLGYGFPILFIHGWACTRNFWNCVRDLPNFRKILFDMRGHGDSDPAKNYNVERMLLDVEELLYTLGIKELSIVGHSLGGIIATKFATMYEEYKIKHLILVATPPTIKMSGLKLFFTGIMLRFLSPILKKSITPKMLYKPTQDLLEFIWSESAKGSTSAYIKLLKSFNGLSIIDDLPKIKAKKIAIIPSHDNYVPTEYQKQVYSELCDDIVVINETGHNLMLEKPQEFKNILEKVLTS